MSDFSLLNNAWVEWMGRIRMSGVAVSIDCEDCEVSFVADDQSFHVRNDNGWWTVDVVDDREKRYDGVAKFSTFELMEKYLIWRWASFARTALGLPSLGSALYKQGYDVGVVVVPTDNEWRNEIRSTAGNAVLGQPNSTIFSHLMGKPLSEIDRLVREGL